MAPCAMNAADRNMHKFVRTPHILGSKFQHGDDDMEAVCFDELSGKHLVVEEKLDGANSGISFVDGKLMLQSRGHYLRGGPREAQFELFKQWAATHQRELYNILGDQYVCYGEWCFAAHTVWYDRLPHYFMEFDVLDTQTGEFLSTPARDSLLRRPDVRVRIEPVRVIATGEVDSVSELSSMIGQSAFINCDDHWGFYKEVLESQGKLHEYRPEYDFSWMKAANEAGYFRLSSPDGWMCAAELEKYNEAKKKFYVGPLMEGLYIKHEEGGVVKGRYKYVRSDFTSHVAGVEEHWHDRPILQNKLAPGAMERMFEQ